MKKELQLLIQKPCPGFAVELKQFWLNGVLYTGFKTVKGIW